MSWLTDNGFVETDGKYVKSIQQTVGSINGQPMIQTVTLEIEPLGEGSISNIDDSNLHTLLGYRFPDTDIWVESEEELAIFIR